MAVIETVNVKIGRITIPMKVTEEIEDGEKYYGISLLGGEFWEEELDGRPTRNDLLEIARILVEESDPEYLATITGSSPMEFVGQNEVGYVGWYGGE